MFDGILAGLSLVSWEVAAFAFIGVLVGQFIAVIPGLGGIFAVAVLLPFIYTMDPYAAVAMIVGAAVVSNTGNTITSVLFGIPGSPTGVAVMFDGYPMTKKGLGERAVTAGLTASAVGGVIGAIAMLFIIPVALPIALAVGPPEFFLLIVLAMTMMAFMGGDQPIKGLISGALGLLIATVGRERSTGTARYTFGELYLTDGIALVPLLIGIFAVAEAIALASRRGAIAEGTEHEVVGRNQTREGFFDVFRHWVTTLRSSVTGVLVGAVPGLGGDAAGFLAYAQASRKTKPGQEKLGSGVVQGVIAADAASNSKDGGALLPTLAFGVPGSASMAILLAAFITLGFNPGSEMLTTNVDLVWLIILVLVFANVASAAMLIAAAKQFARLTFLDSAWLVPGILAVSVYGSYSTTFHVGDIVVCLMAGLFGYILDRAGYSRTLLVIGLVLGPLAEHNLLLAMQIYGWEFVSRPLSAGLVIGLVLTIFLGVRSVRRK